MDGFELGWSFRLGPGVYNAAALDAIAPTGSKRGASGFLLTQPGYQLLMYTADDCSGTPLVITNTVTCLGCTNDEFNDNLGCLKVLAIP